MIITVVGSYVVAARLPYMARFAPTRLVATMRLSLALGEWTLTMPRVLRDLTGNTDVHTERAIALAADQALGIHLGGDRLSAAKQAEEAAAAAEDGGEVDLDESDDEDGLGDVAELPDELHGAGGIGVEQVLEAGNSSKKGGKTNKKKKKKKKEKKYGQGSKSKKKKPAHKVLFSAVKSSLGLKKKKKKGKGDASMFGDDDMEKEKEQVSLAEQALVIQIISPVLESPAVSAAKRCENSSSSSSASEAAAAGAEDESLSTTLGWSWGSGDLPQLAPIMSDSRFLRRERLTVLVRSGSVKGKVVGQCCIALEDAALTLAPNAALVPFEVRIISRGVYVGELRGKIALRGHDYALEAARAKSQLHMAAWWVKKHGKRASGPTMRVAAKPSSGAAPSPHGLSSPATNRYAMRSEGDHLCFSRLCHIPPAPSRGTNVVVIVIIISLDYITEYFTNLMLK